MKRLALILASSLAFACSAPPSSEDAATSDAQEIATLDTGADAPASDSAREASSDAVSDSGGTGMCAPTWQPTACHDCGGNSNGTTCTQPCMSCDDSHLYRAECDAASGMCRCFIDGVQSCTCTIHNPIGAGGCEPEAYGGSNCCWNVG